MKKLIILSLFTLIVTIAAHAQTNTGTIKSKTYLFEEAVVVSERLAEIEKGTKVEILEANDRYLKVKYGEKVGYVTVDNFQEVKELKKDIFFNKNPNLKEKFRKAIEWNRVVVGMTKEMVELSWGKPDDVNRTTTSYGVSEQWVYGDFPNQKYVYLDDGIVTTIQD